jgi:DNA-binding beta-propeller fold protein YncE
MINDDSHREKSLRRNFEFDRGASMIVKRHAMRLCAVILLLAPSIVAQKISGNAKSGNQPSKAAFPPGALIWPSPPDPPRVRWLAEYSDLAKIKSPTARKSGWVERLTGTKTPEERLELRKPYGIATDSRGRIYTADTQLGTVFVIDPAGHSVERRNGDSRAPMALPAGVAVDSKDRLFVSDAQMHSITCFGPKGDVIGHFGTSLLGRPGGIAIDNKRNRLYVADAAKSQIAVFDASSFEFVDMIGKPNVNNKAQDGTLASPTNLALDRQGNIYVADTWNYRVEIFDPSGKFLRAFGAQGDRPGEFIRPKGIAVDSEGHIYVADAEFNNFQIFSPEGQPLLAIGTLGSDPGQFALIAGLYVDSKDRIFTTEMFVGRVQVFQYISQPGEKAAESDGKGVIQAANH